MPGKETNNHEREITASEMLELATKQAEAAEEAEKKKREQMRAQALAKMQERAEAKSTGQEIQENATEEPDNDYQLWELCEDFRGYDKLIYETEELFDLIYVDGRYCKNRTEAMLFMMCHSLDMLVKELHYKNLHGEK